MNANDAKWLKNKRYINTIAVGCMIFVCFLAGCNGYNNDSLYRDNIKTVCVDIFENDSFERGVEYELTDAVCKRIEAQTPYRIESDKNKADTILSGRITKVLNTALSVERQTGRAMEKQYSITVVVNFKDMNTGELLVDNQSAQSSSSFSEWQSQGDTYGKSLTANKLAEKVVEMMEKQW